jgi:uncharacterized membrane protein HdeD (DUF308 family)
VTEPLWRKGLRALLEGLQEAEDANKNPSGSSARRVESSQPPLDEQPLIDWGRWIALVAGLLAIAGLACWFLPGLDKDSSSVVGGIFLKLSVFFAGIRLAWPQLQKLMQWRLGMAGVLLLMMGGLVFVVRPRLALVVWPILVTLVGGLAFLGWLANFFDAHRDVPRKQKPKRKG